MASGFYKIEDELLLFEDQRIINANYTLRRALRDTYTYPVDGWYWFESELEAKTFFRGQLPNARKIRIVLLKKEARQLLRFLTSIVPNDEREPFLDEFIDELRSLIQATQ